MSTQRDIANMFSNAVLTGNILFTTGIIDTVIPRDGTIPERISVFICGASISTPNIFRLDTGVTLIQGDNVLILLTEHSTAFVIGRAA